MPSAAPHNGRASGDGGTSASSTRLRRVARAAASVARAVVAGQGASGDGVTGVSSTRLRGAAPKAPRNRRTMPNAVPANGSGGGFSGPRSRIVAGAKDAFD